LSFRQLPVFVFLLVPPVFPPLATLPPSPPLYRAPPRSRSHPSLPSLPPHSPLIRRFPRLPHVNKHLTTSRDYQRGTTSREVVPRRHRGGTPPLPSPRSALAYKIRISNAGLPILSPFIICRAAYQAVSFLRWLSDGFPAKTRK